MDPRIKTRLTTKFWVKASALILLTPLASRFHTDPTTRLMESHLWGLIGLVLLMTGIIQIARKNPGGWLWLGYYLYASGFGHYGIMVWIYIILAGLCVWTWTLWVAPKTPGKEEG